ncbi:flagellar hook-associated protein 3 [Marispirochaeta aestuarii]|uniref:Flagellar hook-associated protein 3 n=1 Tax=Marispirochaeta aestuarii TaxID=1963862 RepID=A0A1Y1RVX9_9SPIO|nr:flagellar hook-associated protein 3 [Marispirochaeta aestuarii]ORC34229.1 flagellar hook-associated protein 3 [Marispirochaeta aestuarii]
MNRVSTNQANNDMIYHTYRRQKLMNDLQNKMAEQTRIKELRDAPVAAAHSARFLSRISRLERFQENVENVQSFRRVAEGYMNEANQILHRIREIAVQGATGTFTKDDKKIMGQEVNELLKELVEVANSSGADGSKLFGGDRNITEPFRALESRHPEINGRVISKVDYVGGNKDNFVEISDENLIPAGFRGNNIFWAEQHQIFSGVNAETYTVAEDTAILIDGVRVPLAAGDNIHGIIAKIKDSDAAVDAYLDPVSNSLNIRSTVPHQILLEDEQGGTVLQDLGVVSGNGRPPFNIASDARESGGSVFDMVISLRDSLYSGDTLDIGGRGIQGITTAQNNLVQEIAKLGSVDERMEIVWNRLNREIPQTQEQNSLASDIDMAEAILELKMLEYTHKAALQTAGRILQPTLMDFLR